MRRGEVIVVGPVLDCDCTVVVLAWDCCWTSIGLVLDGSWTSGGQLARNEEAGEGVITRASVGGGEDREAREGGEGSGDGGRGRGLTAAERSASKGAEEATGTDLVRPSSSMLWSLSLFQHGRQMRSLIETSRVEASCNVKMSAEGSG